MYYLNMSFVQQQCTVITPLMTCLSPVRVAGDGRVKSPLLGPSHLHRHPPSAREVNMSLGTTGRLSPVDPLITWATQYVCSSHDHQQYATITSCKGGCESNYMHMCIKSSSQLARIKIAFMDRKRSGYNSTNTECKQTIRSCPTLQPKLVRNKGRIFIVPSNHGC